MAAPKPSGHLKLKAEPQQAKLSVNHSVAAMRSPDPLACKIPLALLGLQKPGRGIMAQDALGLVGLWFSKRHPLKSSAGLKQHPLMP